MIHKNKNYLVGNKLRQLNEQLFSTFLIQVGANIRVKVRQNNFLAGYILLDENLFQSCKRSSKNLFHLFGPGLGINSEIINQILPFFGINKICIPYEGSNLYTTVSKWKALGISSPFVDRRVDKQLILSLDEITMDDAERYLPRAEINQLSQLQFFF